ncbi:MAG: CPBP family intramembrane metalloprotease [Candidatus Methanoperedens sp.]|nr:CPBP family intramembrane metalloprotease [Candidatus Methanoperedens sp.]
MKKGIFLASLGIVFGEMSLFLGHTYSGIAIHIINLQILTLAIIFGRFSSYSKNVFQSLILLLLLRIVNIAMPQFFTTTLLWYSLIYGVMFLPIYIIINNQNMTLEDLGLNSRRLHLYLPAALLIGTAAALVERRIIDPIPLIDSMNISGLLMLTIVMFIFVGAVEELIFRSILQTRLEKVLGLKPAILLSGILFGIMHSNYGIVNEIIFASVFGIILGYIFQKTRSFPFILIIHGYANILLFGLIPILST